MNKMRRHRRFKSLRHHTPLVDGRQSERGVGWVGAEREPIVFLRFVPLSVAGKLRGYRMRLLFPYGDFPCVRRLRFMPLRPITAVRFRFLTLHNLLSAQSIRVYPCSSVSQIAFKRVPRSRPHLWHIQCFPDRRKGGGPGAGLCSSGQSRQRGLDVLLCGI